VAPLRQVHYVRQALFLQLNPTVVQVWLAQQGWLSPPQVPQTEVSRSQPRPAPVQVCPAQHGWPMPPHTAQV
jgi:hypothetical protein